MVRYGRRPHLTTVPAEVPKFARSALETSHRRCSRVACSLAGIPHAVVPDTRNRFPVVGLRQQVDVHATSRGCELDGVHTLIEQRTEELPLITLNDNPHGRDVHVHGGWRGSTSPSNGAPALMLPGSARAGRTTGTRNQTPPRGLRRPSRATRLPDDVVVKSGVSRSDAAASLSRRSAATDVRCTDVHYWVVEPQDNPKKATGSQPRMRHPVGRVRDCTAGP